MLVICVFYLFIVYCNHKVASGYKKTINARERLYRRDVKQIHNNSVQYSDIQQRKIIKNMMNEWKVMHQKIKKGSKRVI